MLLNFTRKKESPFVLRRESESNLVVVPGWPGRDGGAVDSRGFVSDLDHDQVLSQMLLSHQSADFCLVGGKVKFDGFLLVFLQT